MATALAPLRFFDRIVDKTSAVLQSLGLCTGSVPAEFASLEIPDSEVSLAATNWHVGCAKVPRGDCRVFRCSEPRLEFIQVLIFPTRPDRVPVFFAAIERRPCGDSQAYVDLHTPGMSVRLRDEVSELSAALAIRHAMFLATPAQPPGWISAMTQNGLVVEHNSSQMQLNRLIQAHVDYLNSWADFASRVEDSSHSPKGQRDLYQYKRRFERLAPARDALSRLFGPRWTARFLGEFLSA